VLDLPPTTDGIESAAEETVGWEIVRREVVFYGYCPDCRA
jgi:Fe2+ or Zn2+ uptake regulation protein